MTSSQSLTREFENEDGNPKLAANAVTSRNITQNSTQRVTPPVSLDCWVFISSENCTGNFHEFRTRIHPTRQSILYVELRCCRFSFAIHPLHLESPRFRAIDGNTRSMSSGLLREEYDRMLRISPWSVLNRIICLEFERIVLMQQLLKHSDLNGRIYGKRSYRS